MLVISAIFDYDQEAVLDKDIYHAKKSTVFIVDLPRSNVMERPNKINNGSIASFATKHLFINNRMSKNVMKNFGSSSGSWKVTLYGNYPRSQATADQNSNASKTIGLAKHLKRALTIPTSGVFYSTALTSTKMGAL